METCEFCHRQVEQYGDVCGQTMCVDCYDAATSDMCDRLEEVIEENSRG